MILFSKKHSICLLLLLAISTPGQAITTYSAKIISRSVDSILICYSLVFFSLFNDHPDVILGYGVGAVGTSFIKSKILDMVTPAGRLKRSKAQLVSLFSDKRANHHLLHATHAYQAKNQNYRALCTALEGEYISSDIPLSEAFSYYNFLITKLNEVKARTEKALSSCSDEENLIKQECNDILKECTEKINIITNSLLLIKKHPSFLKQSFIKKQNEIIQKLERLKNVQHVNYFM